MNLVVSMIRRMRGGFAVFLDALLFVCQAVGQP